MEGEGRTRPGPPRATCCWAWEHLMWQASCRGRVRFEMGRPGRGAALCVDGKFQAHLTTVLVCCHQRGLRPPSNYRCTTRQRQVVRQCSA